MARKIFTQIENPELKVVNTSTGEIVSGVANYQCATIDEFIMCFLSSIPEVTKYDGNTMRVLMWCWVFSSFNLNIPEANTITNNKAFKDKIRQCGGDLSDATIDKAIHTLYKGGMLQRQCRGSYYLNPQYFFRGTLTNRAKLQYTISFDGSQKRII